jgi:hypothetical protein
MMGKVELFYLINAFRPNIKLVLCLSLLLLAAICYHSVLQPKTGYFLMRFLETFMLKNHKQTIFSYSEVKKYKIFVRIWCIVNTRLRVINTVFHNLFEVAEHKWSADHSLWNIVPTKFFFRQRLCSSSLLRGLKLKFMRGSHFKNKMFRGPQFIRKKDFAGQNLQEKLSK